MTAFGDSPSDLWTPGHDQFGNPCWRNKLTLKLHYFDTPPGQPPAFPPPAFAGHPCDPHLPIGRPFEHAPRPPVEGFPPWIQKPHVTKTEVVRGEVAAFHDSPSDLWTPGYDQIGNFCWRNKLTQKLHYFDTPPGQPPAIPPPAFAGHPCNPHLPIGRPFEHAPPPPAEGFFPQELGKVVRFQAPPPNVPGPAAAKGWTLPPFPFSLPKKSKNEAGQWFLQRNEKGEEYYLNTSTWEWQFERPDCIKK